MTDRDRDILLHVKRYRITTNEVLRVVFGLTDDALKGVRKRLLAQGHLVARPLGIGRTQYYQLTPKAAKLLGEPEATATPLGLQSLPRAYGVLVFCCLGSRRHERLNRDELREHLPELVDANLTTQADYYLDEWGDTLQLTRIVINHTADWQQTIRKCRRFIDDLSNLDDYDLFIAADNVRLTILVGEEEMKTAILAGLAATKEKLLIRTPSVHVVSQLTALLNPKAE